MDVETTITTTLVPGCFQTDFVFFWKVLFLFSLYIQIMFRCPVSNKLQDIHYNFCRLFVTCI